MRNRLVVLVLLAVAVVVAVSLYPYVEGLPYHVGIVIACSTGAAAFFVLFWFAGRYEVIS